MDTGYNRLFDKSGRFVKTGTPADCFTSGGGVARIVLEDGSIAKYNAGNGR